MGNYVKRGQDAKAWRVGTGEFQLVIDPDDDKETQDAEHKRALAYAQIERRKSRRQSLPAARIAPQI